MQGGFGWVMALVAVALVIPPYWILWRRTGHSGAWALFLLLPISNILCFYILAFKRWPIDKQDDPQ